MKGVEKLVTIFKKKYNFLDIKIINEKEFSDEFYKFNDAFNKIVKKKYFIIDDNKKENIEYNSFQEDELFKNLIEFNSNYNNIKNDSSISSEEYRINDSLLAKLKEFYNNKDMAINNLMCKKILRDSKKAKLNFYIWLDGINKHYSLVFNLENDYIFLDPCSLYFQRWPTKIIVSDNYDDKLFHKYHVLVMLSFIQNDEFNCVSFAFAFIEILIKLYEEKKEKGLINYLTTYFCYLQSNTYVTESHDTVNDYMDPKLYLLPFEFLLLVKSKSKLRYLKKEAEKLKRYKDVKLIDEIIKRDDNGIEQYRKFHLQSLKENLN